MKGIKNKPIESKLYTVAILDLLRVGLINLLFIPILLLACSLVIIISLITIIPALIVDLWDLIIK